MTTIGILTLSMNIDEMEDIFIYKDMNIPNYFLFDYSKNDKDSINQLINYRETMIDNNIKLLSGMELSENIFKYQNDYLNSYNSNILLEGNDDEQTTTI